MTVPPAHFTASRDGFVPSVYAHSHWGPDHLNGPAVVGLAAHCLERDHGLPDLQPARLTVDLFRAARDRPTTVSTRLIRDGRRIRNAECDVVQDGAIVARATLVLYRRSASPPGEQWSPDIDFTFPDGLDPDEDPPRPLIGSAGAGWSRRFSDHQNNTRTRFVDKSINVLSGQQNSPFVRAAVVAESTSLVTHLGTHGIGYINGDLTVGLTRLPVDEWIGVQEDTHWANDGISVGTATLFDSAGAFGSGMVTAVANPAAQIDFNTKTLHGTPI